MFKKLLILLIVLGVFFAALMVTTGQSRFEISDNLWLATPSDQVWKAITAIEQWPHWWPGVESAGVTPDVQAGARLSMQLRGNPTKAPATIESVVPERQLSWQRESILGSTAATKIILQSTTGRTQVTLVTSIRGPQAVLARFTGEQEFARYHQRVLEALEDFLARPGPKLSE